MPFLLYNEKAHGGKSMKRKLIYNICMLASFLFVYFTSFGCISKVLFNVTCPGCGMMRAIKSLLKLDIGLVLYYNPMVFSLPLIYLYIINDGNLFRNRKINNIVLVLILMGFIINHIVRIFTNIAL